MKDPLQSVETVNFDINAEIMKMARADGLPSVKHLDLQVTMTHREYYRATIMAHYRGKEEGFNEGAGFKLRTMQRLRAICTAAVYFFVASMALVGICTVILRIIR
jgi:hypothetical protein